MPAPPTLVRETSSPAALRRPPALPGAKVFWTLKATYPAPYGMVWLRYYEVGHDPYLELLNAQGQRLQQIPLSGSISEKPPLDLRALYLEPGRQRGPVLYFKTTEYHYLCVFAEGFTNFLSLNTVWIDKEEPHPLQIEPERRGTLGLKMGKDTYAWSGVSFVQNPTPSTLSADVYEGKAPLRWPLTPTREETRFAAVMFHHLYFLRWIPKGERAILEILDKSGRRIAYHNLSSSFGASPRFTTLTAMWLEEKQKRGPVLEIRESDMLELYVFSDSLRTLHALQDFSDFSNSISSTTTSFGRDKNGLLTVTESTIENEGDGKQTAPSERNYHWNGKRFVEVKK
jgi:hypothetical protein